MKKNKQNPLLAKYEAMYEAKCRIQLQIAMQMGLDAGMIAANDVFGMGAGRAEKFRTAYIETVNSISGMMVDDGNSDSDLVWSRSKVDERIKQIVGEDNFVPWEERYRSWKER